MDLTVLIDVAGLSDSAVVLLRLVLIARMLFAYRKAGGQLNWHCKVVSLLSALKVFENAFGIAAEALLGALRRSHSFAAAQQGSRR